SDSKNNNQAGSQLANQHDTNQTAQDRRVNQENEAPHLLPAIEGLCLPGSISAIGCPVKTSCICYNLTCWGRATAVSGRNSQNRPKRGLQTTTKTRITKAGSKINRRNQLGTKLNENYRELIVHEYSGINREHLTGYEQKSEGETTVIKRNSPTRSG